MNRHLRFIYLLLLFFSLSICAVVAQTDFASEQEFKKQAAKLFAEEEYEKAYPLYSQLLSLYRKDPDYNYRLGVCMLFAGDDKERAIFFLEFAVRSSEVEKERFFYLAKAYHLNYRFDDAIAKYKAYKKIASSAKAERLQVDRQIEMCENGKSLLRTITNLSVIDKTEMSREDFFRSYDVSGIGGKLLVKPDEKEFMTALDKKKNEKSIIYLAANGNQIYFSSYGDNEQHGKDIYEMKKLPSGEWSKPQSLGNVVNTKYDESYPFLHPNGKVLYFCSKGHNSMGGYDIFKSIYFEETNTWTEPVNLDFPINTPDDDILYVTNTDETKAFFSSARASVAGKIAVYHINSERKPVDVAYIRGAVIKTHDRQSLDVKITVKNLNDNTIIGVYNSKPATGAYDIKLPNGGRFSFTVEAADFTTQSEIVVVPIQNEFKPLKQEMSYTTAMDKLTIKNSFDEVVNDTTYLLALNFIKEKSQMDVAAVSERSPEVVVPKEENPTAEENAAAQPISTTQTTTKLSNDDIVKIAYKDAEDAKTEAKDAREQADIALDLANQKNEKAKGKLQESAALMAAASKAQDNIKKQALTDEANAVNKDAERLNQETVVTFNLAKKLDITASSKQEEADLSQQYAKGLEAAVKSTNSTDALAKLAEQEKKLDSITQVNADRFPILSGIKKEEEYKKREWDKAIQLSKDLKGEMADNQTIISSLKTDAEKTKSSQEKQGMNNQIAELVQENTTKQKAFEQNEIKQVRLQKEYTTIKNETELVSTVVDQSKTGTSETAAAKVVAIDKNKLEQQVTTIQSTSPATNDIASANTAGDNASSETSAPNTTPKAFIEINKKYETDLAAAEKIENKGDKEREKADVLKKWSVAIDADVVKQKQDLEKTTDTEMKALFAKKISDAENSSKEKQKQADQSLAKVKTEQKDIPLAEGIGKTYNNKNAEDTATTVANAENKLPQPEKEYSYGTVANEQITNANVMNNQANDLAAQADVLKSEAVKETNIEAKKAKVKQSENLIKESKQKKLQANQQIATANKAEYQTTQKQLEQYTETYSTNAADQISMAEMNNDEAKIYFEKAQKFRTQADTISSYASKETANENAYKNEMIGLEKQKKSMDIYKNFKPGAVTASATTTVKNTTVTGNTPPVATTNAVDKPANAVTNEKQSSYNSPVSVAQIVKADALNQQAADLMEQSVDLKFKAVEQKDNAEVQDAMYAQSEDLIKQANEKKSEASQLIAKANESEYTANQNNNNTEVANNRPPTLTVTRPLINEVFEQKPKAVYSVKNPIPINEVLPEGLVFKVQVGAFRKPIPQDLFQGMSPLMGETTPKGFIRYTAGLFTKYNNADKVKNTIVNLGYKDAFVVAFLDGKRIPINQAYAMDAGVPPTILRVNNRPENTTQNSVTTTINQTAKQNQQTDIVKSTSISTVSGLFYTVQVGVFSQKVSPAKLYNMEPLYSEIASNGNLRYYTGAYKSSSRATEAKDMVVDIGIKDAFVTAYYNGKRISKAEAKKYESQGDGVFPKLPNFNKLPVFKSVSRIKNQESRLKNQEPSIKNQEPTANNSIMSIDSGIVFKLQIGAFKEEVPLEVANKFIKIASKGIKNYKDNAGLTIYTVGNFKTYDEAYQLKAEVMAADLADTFIVAYRNGEKIGIEEAKKLTTKKVIIN